jgi:hypothetical protein
VWLGSTRRGGGGAGRGARGGVGRGGAAGRPDDLTREGLADALGEQPHPDEQLAERLRARFRAFGRMPASNLRQALIDPSAEALDNPIGTAPGWWVEKDGSQSSAGRVVVVRRAGVGEDQLTQQRADGKHRRLVQSKGVVDRGQADHVEFELAMCLVSVDGPSW